ncbi:hypothetical protein BSLA_02f4998 [Burkholderia stabilis]|nr:hypothetical protein BSLA_02f4998 [Burkholderia stabilis]
MVPANRIAFLMVVMHGDGAKPTTHIALRNTRTVARNKVVVS